MNTVIIRPGKYLCLELDVIPVLLRLLSEEEDEERKKRRKTLVIYCLRALTGLSEAPEGRVILSNELPLLERRSNEQDEDVRRAAQTAIKVVTWKP
ncbi:radial spoke head 14 homolog [Poecilia latipinna]|nr:PREDICTED: radial spoke head 14 homolog [Poecilia formosa]XP_014871248.1 PREDICTED: radial spoke head 14 homolog [Poecilia latipinna]